MQWTEDDLPAGVGRLDLTRPDDDTTYVMYHGTSRQNVKSIQDAGFRQSIDGMLGRGVYLSRVLEKAKYYPVNHPEFDKVVIRVLVNVGKVIAINYEGHPHQMTWHDYGYDMAWVPPGSPGLVRGNLEVDCVWDPNRIHINQIITPR